MAPFGNLFKSVAEFIKGSTPPYVLGQAQKSGLHPEYDDKFLIDNDDNWPYICSRIVASCIAQQPIRLFATRSTGQQRARTRSGGAGRVLKRSSEDYAYLKNHPYIRKQANFNGAEEVEEIYDHPLLDLLNAVNDSQNGFEAMYLTSVYMDLTGDAYWHLEAHSQDMGHSLVHVIDTPALVTVLLGQLDTAGPAWPVAEHDKGFVMFSSGWW